jgi:hypothetical protein
MNTTDLKSVIKCAELAPSVHNTQPWSFMTSPEFIEIRADRARGLPVLDPAGRELTVSCGATTRRRSTRSSSGHSSRVWQAGEPGSVPWTVTATGSP